MLGLKRGIVKLVRHRPEWRGVFQAEKERLEKKIGHLIVDIQHIGSTAIPGIAAKPVLDVAIGVRSLAMAKNLIRPMEKLGYRHVKRSHKHHELFFVKGPESKRTHHIHVLRHRGIKWKRNIAFRDYLQIHPKQAKAYEALKKKLAKKFADNRVAYTAAKEKFFLQTAKLAARSLGSCDPIQGTKNSIR